MARKCSCLPAGSVVRSAPHARKEGRHVPHGPSLEGRARHPRGPRSCSCRRSRGWRPWAGGEFGAAPGRLIVNFSSDSTARTVARRQGWKVLDTILGDGSAVLQVPRGTSVRAFAKTVKGRARVAYAEPDFRVRAFDHTGDQTHD